MTASGPGSDGKDRAGSCCAPVRPLSGPSGTANPPGPGGTGSGRDIAVAIPGGLALVGTADPQLPVDGEGPLRRKRVAPFRIAATAVSNAEFAAFVKATGFVTEAERFGWSFVFWSDVPDTIETTQGVAAAQWWRRVDGSNWRDVNGPGTAADAWYPDHPAVHISWSDARAYAAWVGGRLPTEAEWEHAARGGQGDVRFPWGDLEPDDRSHFPCNIWQGTFPDRNTVRDGFATTAPVTAYAPNPYGLYNMVGNVWEWVADPFRIRSNKRDAKARQAAMKGYRVAKGGSFLCHRSYCYRYRIAARIGNTPDSTTTHTGFRVVWDI